jgi:peptidyl-prolyl cis-trans isomerase D
MLDVMRKYSRSLIIYVFFGIIIAVFVINFGPQSAGCTATTTVAARVEGHSISPVLFNYAMAVSGLRERNIPEPQMVQLRAIVMDHLLVRELLADDALDQGFRVSDKEIDDMIVKGRFLALGQPHPLIRSDAGKFDYDLFSRWVRYQWQLNVKKFKEEQRRELLAEKMRQHIRSLVRVSEDEVHSEFLVRSTQVQLAYVRFSPSDFRSKIAFDEAKLRSFINANKKKIEQYYKDNQAAYQKLPKQVRLQAIQIKATGPTAKPTAREKAERALAQLRAGEPFAKVAAADSEDPDSRAAGGMLSWRNEDNPGFDEVINKQIAKLPKDQLSGVLEGKDAFVIVKVLGRRQGDLNLAQAEEEIGDDLFKNEEGVRLATQEADSFIRRAKSGAKLEDLFTTEEVKTEPEKAEAGETADAAGKAKEAEEPAKPDDPSKPAKSPLKLSSTSLFSRSGRHLIPGIGISREIMSAAFKLKQGEVMDKPFVVGQMVYLVAVTERKHPDLAEWTKRKDDLIEEFLNQKWSRVLREYSLNRCEGALRSKRLHVNTGTLVTPGYAPDKKEGPLPSFAACSSLQERAL